MIRAHDRKRKPELELDPSGVQKLKVSYVRMLRYPLLLCWPLMILTFSLPGRSAPSALGSIDVLALAKVLLRILVVAVMTYVFVQLEMHPKRGTVVRTLIPLGVFIAWAILSTAWSPLKSVSIGQAGGLLALALLALNFGTLCDGQEDLSRVLSNLSTCLFLISVAVLLLYFAFPSAGSMQREGSGLLHATSTASTASLGMIILVGARLLWGWRWTRILLAPAIMVNATVLVLSANRTSMFLTILIVATLIWMYGNRSFLTGIVFGISLLTATYVSLDPGLDLALGGAAATASFVERGEATDLADFSGRREMWQIIWNSFLQSPFLGHGYFVSSRTGELYVWYQWANFTAHNLTLQVLVSTGVIGLMLFFWSMARPLTRLFDALKSSGTRQRLAVLSGLLCLWYFIWGLFNASFMGPIQPESVVFFTMFGLSIGNFPATEERYV